MSPLSIEAAAGWRIVSKHNGGPTVETPVIIGSGEEKLLYAQNKYLQCSAVNFLGKDKGGQAGTREVKVGKTFDTKNLRKSTFHVLTEGFIVTGT